MTKAANLSRAADIIIVNTDDNVGIGVTPESWGSIFDAIQVGGLGSLFSTAAQTAGGATDVGSNVYYDSVDSRWEYIVTDEASRYRQDSGTHVFYVAPSGTADTEITWTNALIINNAGNVGMGVTPENWLSTQTALQIGGLASFMAESSQVAGSAMQISNNGYRDATSWKYIVTDKATRYVQDNGEHRFFVAANGTADTAISWTTALTIDNTANAGLAGNFTFGANSYGSLIESGGDIYIDNTNTSAITYFRNDNSGGIQKTCIALGGITPYVRLYYDDAEKLKTTIEGVETGTFSTSGASGGAKMITGTSGLTGALYMSATSTSTLTRVGFYNPNGSVGTIQTSGTSTAYNTTSDKRLKTSLGLTKNAADIINQIEIHDYYFNSDPSKTLHGVMAQDCNEVYPNAISHDEENDIWGADYSKLVPILLANIQELNKKVEALEKELKND